MSANREGQGTKKSGQKPKDKDQDNRGNEQQQRDQKGHDARVQQREKGPKPSR